MKEQRSQSAAAMTRLASRIARADSLHEGFRAIAEEVAAALSVPIVTIYLFSGRSGVGTCAYAHGVPEGIDASPFPRGSCEKMVGTYGAAARFPDIRAGADLPLLESMVQHGLRSLAYAAAGAPPAPVGLLTVVTTGDEERSFDDEEMELLRSCAEITEATLIRDRRTTNQKQILEMMTEGVALVNENREVLYVNPAFEKMLEYGPGEITGAPGAAMWFPEDQASSAAHWEAMKKGDAPMRRLARLRAKSGAEVWVTIAMVAIGLGETFGGAVAVISDVTQTRRLEAKIQQAQKLESLGVLAGGIAHDFNNLLVGILGNAGLALEELPPEAPAREQIADIHAAAVRAAELTKQLLAYAGKGRFVIGKIDLRRLVEEMTHLIAAVLPKNVVVKYNLAYNLPAIDGDATQLRQLVMNLVTNAADAIGKRSGIVTISTSVVEVDRAYLADTYLDEGLPSGYYVSLEVADTGTGMSAETRARIFDPFFTTKFTGRGLGLAAVLGILRAHRGAIKVYSEPGRGSTFRALFPAANGGPDSIRPTVSRRPKQESGVILIIDDDEAVRGVAKRSLERAGFRVLTASDGVEGLEIFEAHKDEIRAVILDLTMPRMGGEETFRRLRQLTPDVRVLLSSGYSEQEATSVFAGKGLAGFVEKPFTSSTLLERLRAVLGPDEKKPE